MDLPSFSPPSFSAPDMSVKSPFTETQERTMKEEAEKFLEQFGKIYMTSYKTNLIAKVKNDLKGSEPSPYKLKEKGPPGAPQIVKTGWLTKRGDFIKSWKKRYFIIYSNGAVEYYAKEQDPKPKGVIDLEGYRVDDNPPLEAFGGKQFCFIFTHQHESDKRVWHIYADGEEEKKDFVQAFTQACRVATGYVNPDPVVRKSFASAYAKIRRYYGMWSQKPRGPEQEALSEVVYDRLYDVVVREVVQDLDGIPKKMAIKAAKTVISGLVSASWKGLDQATGKLRPKIEETLKKAMNPFLEAENKFKEKVHENLDEKLLSPVMTKVFSPFFERAVGILHPMVIDAYNTQLSITAEKSKKPMADLKDNLNAATTFKEYDKSLDIKTALAKLPMKNLGSWGNKVDELLSLLNEIDDIGGIVGKMKTELNDNIKPSVEIVFPPTIEEDMIRMCKNTSYTAEKDFEESANAEVSVNGTTAKLDHDIRLRFTDVVNSSLKAIVQKPYEDFVDEPAREALAPLSDEIPEDFKEIMDPEAILMETLEETLDECISSSVASAIEQQVETLTKTLSENGIRPLE